MTQLPRYQLRAPASFLRLFRDDDVPQHLSLDDIGTVEMWALAGLAALARRNGEPALEVANSRTSEAGRFASAVGFEDVVAGLPSTTLGEAGRTIKLQRIRDIQEVERVARRIVDLMLPASEEDETRSTLLYVLVELMRNAVQHSRDPKGGVVAAQLMKAGYAGYPRAVIQVAVADAGVGVLEALRASHPELESPSAALVFALRPHISGTFTKGRTGSAYNAGMGLFFISEMTKLTQGRLLLASRGAALSLRGHEDGYAGAHIEEVAPTGSGFPGTLVAFEIPLGEVHDHAGLIEVIASKARERAPSRDLAPWMRFEKPPEGVSSFVVHPVAEDISGAARLAATIEGHLVRREPVALDFRGMKVCTQSFLHALLFTGVRLSWAVQVPIYVENVAPGVAAGLRLVDNYARGG